MKVLFLTNEYPPNIYGGAGVHVGYLSRELAKAIPVEVRCFGNQRLEEGNLKVVGFELDDPRLVAVTVTDVVVSDDLRDAKVFVLVEGTDHAPG